MWGEGMLTIDVDSGLYCHSFFLCLVNLFPLRDLVFSLT